jgi:histidinol-phosphatase (PHP family)
VIGKKEATMKTNYHTHTTRCNHASGTEREYIETAIARGLDTLGFSDHSPYFFDGDYYSSFRMKREQVEEYVSTLCALREEYKDKIRILIGYEAEYYPKHFAKFIDFIEGYGYDYLILGQHVLGNEDSHSSAAATEKEEYLARYVDQTLEGLSSGKFLYFAHPDIINYRGDEKIYEKYISRLCEGAKDLGVPLEINMLGVYDRRHYPSDRFLKIAAEVGNDFIIGCDAHWPNAVAEPTSLEGAMELARRHGIIPKERLI